MDVELARTFLAIVKTQSFIRAGRAAECQPNNCQRSRSIALREGWQKIVCRNKSGARRRFCATLRHSCNSGNEPVIK